MLADLSAEHDSWVATGDKANPDASTVMEPSGCLVPARAMGDTYTGATLAYLKQAHFYHDGSRCAAFGIGDLAGRPRDEAPSM